MIAALILAIAFFAQPELIERTLALVGGQPITLGDTRAATQLGLLDANLSPASDVLSRMVDRELIMREVQRYDPTAPAESAVEARLDAIRQRFPDAAGLNRVLETTGFSELRLRSWVRDDLRAQAYLAQRFASATAPTDSDVMRVYTEQRAQFDRQGLTFEQAAPAIRDRLISARRIELINDWLSDLRRRTDVVILPQ